MIIIATTIITILTFDRQVERTIESEISILEKHKLLIAMLLILIHNVRPIAIHEKSIIFYYCRRQEPIMIMV